ncbi:MAG: hypothetical protein ACO27P_12395, partial [Burkholderiaceae bacterium]
GVGLRPSMAGTATCLDRHRPAMMRKLPWARASLFGSRGLLGVVKAFSCVDCNVSSSILCTRAV